MPVLVENANDIQLNTQNEVDQILGRPPSWLLRWGITLIFLTVIIFGIIAWIIKYPDVIPVNVKIITDQPAIRVVARSSGAIQELRVANNEQVSQGDLIAILDNPARLDDIEQLAVLIGKLADMEHPLDRKTISPPENLVLGNIQPSYARLVQKIDDYQYFLNSSGVFSKINALKSRMTYLDELSQNLQKQQQTAEQEIQIARRGFLRQKQLNKDGVVSDIDLENTETQFLQQQRQLEGIDNQIINNKIAIEQLKTQIIELKEGRKDGKNAKEFGMKEDIESLKSEIAFWKQSYLITAPIAGKVSFAKIWSPQQFVNANEEVLTIVPLDGVGKIIGKAILPIQNSGKVKRGQMAKISLNGFPFQEYGVLTAQITHISLVPVNMNRQQGEESYLLDMELPDRLVTTYDKLIPFRQEMQGTANIITEDRRVLMRIFDRVNSILKN